MTRTIARVCAVWVFALLAAAAPAAAEKRVALVIGNSSYQVGPLANPVNDATAVAKALEAIGFDKVILKTNLAAGPLRAALRDFGAKATGSDIAVLYYAGHGTEIGGRNYLIPTDAKLERASDVAFEAVALGDVLAGLEGARQLRLVILDACRNSVFPMAGSTRSVARGLARIEPEGNTLVAFAAKEGTTADDGTGGKNSPFTAALLKHIATPGLDVTFVFRRVRDDVMAATSQKQQPHLYGTLGGGEVYLRNADAAAAGASPPAATAKPSASAAEVERLRAEIEELRRKQGMPEGSSQGWWPWKGKEGEPEQDRPAEQAMLEPPPKPEPAAKPEVKPAPAPPAASTGMTPGTVFRDCADCPEMVVVPAGRFTMGSSPSEIAALTKEYGDYFKDEGPTRSVTIAKPFAVGKLEVTRDEFEAFVKATGHSTGDKCWTFENNKAEERSGRSFRNPGYSQGGNHPVVCISWDDAKAYVGWLSQKSGKSYRLLTEAEWEYATRAGTSGRYSFGNDASDLCGYANGADQTAKGSGLPKDWTYAKCKDGHERTAPTGSFKPNAFGLYDMHGNVWEWVEDCYKDSYQGAPSDGSASTSGDCSRRVLRGGSWLDYPRNLRSAGRDWYSTVVRHYSFGLRVGRTLTP